MQLWEGFLVSRRGECVNLWSEREIAERAIVKSGDGIV